MNIMIATLMSLLAVISCKTPDQTETLADTKAIYKIGISSGDAIGPILDDKGNITLIRCESLDKYKAYFKSASGKDSQNWSQSHCRPFSNKSDAQVVKPIWITKKDTEKFKKQINQSLWKRCLQDQFWFCDDSKIKSEIDAAFSPGEHMGRLINGDDWIKIFWDTANLEAQSFQTP